MLLENELAGKVVPENEEEALALEIKFRLF